MTKLNLDNLINSKNDKVLTLENVILKGVGINTQEEWETFYFKVSLLEFLEDINSFLTFKSLTLTNQKSFYSKGETFTNEELDEIVKYITTHYNNDFISDGLNFSNCTKEINVDCSVLEEDYKIVETLKDIANSRDMFVAGDFAKIDNRFVVMKFDPYESEYGYMDAITTNRDSYRIVRQWIGKSIEEKAQELIEGRCMFITEPKEFEEMISQLKISSYSVQDSLEGMRASTPSGIKENMVRYAFYDRTGEVVVNISHDTVLYTTSSDILYGWKETVNGYVGFLGTRPNDISKSLVKSAGKAGLEKVEN